MEQRVRAYSGSEPYAFVSYAHKNRNIVYPIIERLVDMGYNIWYDEGIPLISDYGGELYRQIMGCSVFLLFESHQAGKSEDVAKEIHHAVHFKKKIARIAIDENVVFPHDVAYHLLPTLQYISIDTEPGEFYSKLTDSLAECKSRVRKNHPEEENEQENHAPVQPTHTAPEAEQSDSAAKKTQPVSKTPKISQPVAMRQPNNIGKFVAVVAAVLVVVAGLVVVPMLIGGGDKNDGGKVTGSSSSTTTTTTTSAPTSTTTTTTTTSAPISTTTTAPEQFPQFENLSVGDHLFFGNYEQDNDLTNGAEPIEWRVLNIRNDGSALLISEYILDWGQYNKADTIVTWETCTLRDWLNDDFYNTAFSSAEQQRILLTTVSNPDNPTYGTDGGRDTRDKVFLLSIDEASEYFSDKTDRRCKFTDYASANGIYAIPVEFGNWHLRSPGGYSDSSASCGSDGSVYQEGGVVDGIDGIRPAVIVRLHD